MSEFAEQMEAIDYSDLRQRDFPDDIERMVQLASYNDTFKNLLYNQMYILVMCGIVESIWSGPQYVPVFCFLFDEFVFTSTLLCYRMEKFAQLLCIPARVQPSMDAMRHKEWIIVRLLSKLPGYNPASPNWPADFYTFVDNKALEKMSLPKKVETAFLRVQPRANADTRADLAYGRKVRAVSAAAVL